LTGAGARLLSQSGRGVKGVAERNDQFGSDLRILNFGKSGAADLAVYIRHESVNGVPDAGAVGVFYGSSNGVTVNDQVWHQNVPGISGAAEQGDQFGVMCCQ
jgi:hypothetical protein